GFDPVCREMSIGEDISGGRLIGTGDLLGNCIAIGAISRDKSRGEIVSAFRCNCLEWQNFASISAGALEFWKGVDGGDAGECGVPRLHVRLLVCRAVQALSDTGIGGCEVSDLEN